MQSRTADILKNKREIILGIWEAEVRIKLPSATNENRLFLRNSLPEFLDTIVHALENGAIEQIKPMIKLVAYKHGTERAIATEYTLVEEIEEFNVLRKIIFKIIEEEHLISPIEREIIFEILNFGVAWAGSEFAKEQMRLEQEAKSLAEIRYKEKLEIENRLSLALKASHVGIWECNMKTGKVIISEEEAWIYSEPEDTREVDFDFLLSKVHPEDREKLKQIYNIEDEVELEFRILLPDGGIKWVGCRGKKFHDEEGIPNRIIGTDIDITFRKQSEEEIKHAALKLKQITDIQPTIIVMIDKEFRFLFVNKSYEKWVDKKIEDIIGKKVSEVIETEAWDFFRPLMERALKGEELTFESKVHYQTGTKFIRAVYKPAYNEVNEIEGLYISVMDLTEHMETLEALKKSEEEFRTLSNTIPQITWVSRPDGYVYWLNDRWYEYTGSTTEESIGWGWLKHTNETFMKEGLPQFMDKINKGEVWESTFPLRNRNGEWHWFLSRSLPIRDSSGNITKWFGTDTDITEQKMTTDKLHHEQSMRDRLLYTLSHDLRTPLSAARMAAQIMAKRTDPNQLQQLSDKAIRNLDRVDKMIQDLLDASRLKAGQLITPDIQEITPHEIVRAVLEDLKTIHGDRFILHADEGFPVFSWRQGLVRILENLCTNAVKYGKLDAPIDLTLKCADDHFVISVHNFGNPIEESNYLFGDFQRTSGAVKSGKKGWGIGLTIVKGITESMGGTVKVERHKDGTTFQITLPKDSRYKIPANHMQENRH